MHNLILFLGFKSLPGKEMGDVILQLEDRISKLERGNLSTFIFCCSLIRGHKEDEQQNGFSGKGRIFRVFITFMFCLVADKVITDKLGAGGISFL